MRRCLSIAVLLVTCLVVAQAAVVHVSASATGAGDGSSWADACTTLQAGLARSADGDQIWIAQGTYTPGSTRSATFSVPAGVALYGGFLGGESALGQRQDDPGLTILSGEIGAAGYGDNIRRLVTMSGSGRLDTLTVTMANYDQASLDDAAGLVALASGAEVALVRCRFTQNRANGPQVILIKNAASALVERCELTSNSEITFSQRTAGTLWFSGCAQATIRDSVVAGITPASSLDFQNAVFFDDCPAYLAENCVVIDCTTVDPVNVAGGTTDPANGIHGCTFLGNRARNVNGGAVRNCIIEPTSGGRTLFNQSVSEHNWLTADSGAAGFADRSSPAGADGIWFTADDGLRLTAGSPCLDTGRFTTATTSTGLPRRDILGLARPQGHDPDPGAYEMPTGNAGPFAIGGTRQVDEDRMICLVLDGSDADGDLLTAIVSGLPALGELFPTADGTTPSGPALSIGDLPWTVPDAQRRVLFRPAPDDHGSAHGTVVFQVRDAAITSYPANLVLDILSVNDAPTIAQSADLAISEDAGQQTVALGGIGAGTPALQSGDAGWESQTLSITATSSDPQIVAHPTVSYTSPGTTAQLAFAPVANAAGDAVITVAVRDDGGTERAGVDLTSMSFTVSVLAINDPPRLDPIPDLAIAEDATGATLTLTGLSPGPLNEAGQTLTLNASTSDPALVRITGIDHTPGSSTAIVHLAPQDDANGNALIFIACFDNGGTADGGADSTAQVCRLSISPVDDPPALTTNTGLVAAAGDSTGIASSQLRISDPDGTPGTALVYTIATPPTHGALRRAGSDLAVGGTFTQADVDGGLLDYRNDGGANASDAWDFTWTDGTTAPQGPATMAITLVGSTLPTIATAGSAADWVEDAAAVTVAGDAVVTDPDPVPWDGGMVSATITTGGGSGDLLGLSEQGLGAGQVSLQGSSVLVGGVAIGLLSGGSGGVPLTIALSGSDATPASAQAIVRAITFANQGGNPGSATRSIAIVVNDGGAGASAPASVQIAVVAVNDPPVIATTWIGIPAGATIVAGLAADDPDGPTRTWTLLSAPATADLAMLDAGTGRLRITAHADAAGTATLRVRLDDGVAAAVEMDIALVVSTPGDARPEPADELPADVHAGGEIDSILRFDLASLGGSPGLDFTASADAPAGLQLDQVASDRVRVRWSIPPAEPPAYVRFAIIASDPASRRTGILPVLLLIRPQPGGGG